MLVAIFVSRIVLIVSIVINKKLFEPLLTNHGYGDDGGDDDEGESHLPPGSPLWPRVALHTVRRAPRPPPQGRVRAPLAWIIMVTNNGY